MFKCFTAQMFHASVANERNKGLMLLQRFTMLSKTGARNTWDGIVESCITGITIKEDLLISSDLSFSWNSSIYMVLLWNMYFVLSTKYFELHYSHIIF